jgi:hypothetical protein
MNKAQEIRFSAYEKRCSLEDGYSIGFQPRVFSRDTDDDKNALTVAEALARTNNATVTVLPRHMGDRIYDVVMNPKTSSGAAELDARGCMAQLKVRILLK